MGYSQTGSLIELFDPDHAHEATRHMAESGTDFLYEHTVLNTPVSYMGLALYYAGYKPSRVPGTLKASWKRMPVEAVHGEPTANGGYSGRVETYDPIAPYVEYDTAPHLIRPKMPGGVLVFRTWPTGELVHTRLVHHPGTKGQHMVGLAVARAENQFEEIVHEDVVRWAREQEAKAR